MNRMTLEKYLTDWIEVYKINLAYNTYRGYMVNLRHICKYIGDIELDCLTYTDIQGCYMKLLETLSGTSVVYCHRVLRNALTYAYKRDIISKNPCDLVIAPRKQRHEITVLNEDELHILLEAAEGTWLYTPILIAATLGLRRGEVMGLRWSDVDFKNNIITISKSLACISGELVLSDVKTAKSHRSLLISDSFAEYLFRLRCDSECEYVCCRCGQPISPNVFDKFFKRTVRSIDIPDICFHDLRHTNATLLLKKGIPAKIVSERLGHSSITITLDTYSHVLIDMQKDSSVAFDDLI